jgi:hypothetical protein
MALVPLYALLRLFTRGVPALLFHRSAQPAARCLGLARHSGTQLSLVVAVTGITVQLHIVPANQATVLVFGGIVTVVLFPILARAFLSVPAGKTQHSTPIG